VRCLSQLFPMKGMMVKGRMMKVDATVILEAGDGYNVSRAGNVGHQCCPMCNKGEE
jgi:hypothetical protein